MNTTDFFNHHKIVPKTTLSLPTTLSSLPTTPDDSDWERKTPSRSRNIAFSELYVNRVEGVEGRPRRQGNAIPPSSRNHSPDRNESNKRFANIKFCKNLIKYGKCSFYGCTFAHNRKTFNPSCIFQEFCKYKGDKCTFLHPEESFEEYCTKLKIPEDPEEDSEEKIKPVNIGGGAVLNEDEQRKSDYLDTTYYGEPDTPSCTPDLTNENSFECDSPAELNILIEEEPGSIIENIDTSPKTLCDRIFSKEMEEKNSDYCIIPADAEASYYLVKKSIREGKRKITIEFNDIENSNTTYCLIPTDLKVSLYLVKLAITNRKKKITIEFND